jgi:hypothetical protein
MKRATAITQWTRTKQISVFGILYLITDTIPSVFKFEDEGLLDARFYLSQ